MSDKILEAINIFTESDWYFKRIFLSIVFGVINIAILVSITSLIIGTGWETLWLIAVLMYGSVYWLLANMLFDALIGDEFDNTNF